MLPAGVDGHLVKWIHSSMWREFQVRWKGILSDLQQVDVGVPQGAVLSPVLFTFYMSDIFEAIGSDVEGLVYADDTYVYCSGPSLDGVLRKLQRDIHDISSWRRYWKQP